MSASTKFIHPTALHALENVYAHANLKPVLVQTQGNAEQSAGTHNSAGKYKDGAGHWQSYSACLDFSVIQAATRLSDSAKVTMNENRIRWFLEVASEFGFAGFRRTVLQGFDAPHLHLLCSMVEINPPSDETRLIVWRQIADFVAGKNGLKGHATETFFHASDENDAHIAALFLAANPRAKSMLPAKYHGGGK